MGHHGVFLISVRISNWYHPSCGTVVFEEQIHAKCPGVIKLPEKTCLGFHGFQACLVVHSFFTLTSSNMVLSGFVFQTIEYWDCPVPKVRKLLALVVANMNEHEAGKKYQTILRLFPSFLEFLPFLVPALQSREEKRHEGPGGTASQVEVAQRGLYQKLSHDLGR